MNFRFDINALRAIAVICVVFFHFSIQGFSAGFLGVDIFFVISGFLMSGIIFKKIELNTFTLSDFYLARAKRIIPALLVLCLCLAFAAYFVLTPSELIALGQQISGASSFTSNILFWRQAGYFDSSAHEKWLLHTWSLSVEWQFYILYPIFIILIKEIFGVDKIRVILVASCIISYLLSATLPLRWIDAGFYLLPTRAWEMLLGGIIYSCPEIRNLKIRNSLNLIGYLLIVISCIGITSTDRWPGWLAIFPCVGTGIIILTNNHNPLLRNTALQYIGNISYSLYLWHWPVVVTLHYFEINHQPQFIALGLLTSLALGTISYQFIETPTRKIKLKRSLLWYSTATITIISIGFTFIGLKGIPLRLNEVIVLADNEKSNRNPRQHACEVTVTAHPKSPGCIFGKDQSKIGLIVVGDSHSNAVITAVADSMPENQGGVLYLGADGCTFMRGLTTKFFPACSELVEHNIDLLNKNYENIPVLVVNRLTASLNGPNEDTIKPINYVDNISNTSSEYKPLFAHRFIETICEVAQHHPIWILEPIPEMGKNVPNQLIYNIRFRQITEDIHITKQEYDLRHKDVKKIYSELQGKCGVKLLDPTPYLCSADKCMGSVNSHSLYYDDDHLSEYGNRKLLALFGLIWG